MEGKRNHVFENWAKTFRCRPELYFEPRNLEELRQILLRAKKESKKVRVCGNCHSPSDLVCTDDFMISMKKFNKVLHINQEDNTVEAEGGIMLYDLNDILDQNGLGLSVLGAISDITLAGAISVGTHGSGKTFGGIHSYVLEIQLMRADGVLMRLNAENDVDIFDAARVSLGSFGVIISLKIQCEPAFRLHQVTFGLPLKDVVENIDVHLSASQHFEYLWFPHTNNCIVHHVNRTSQPIRGTSSWFWETFVGYYLLEFLLWISIWFPGMVGWISRTYYGLQCSKRERVDKSFNVFNFNCLFKQFVMEWAIPRENMGVVMYRLKAWIEANFPTAHFPVEVRFVKEDDAYLSPNYKTNTCYINIVMYRPYMRDVAFTSYWSAFQDIMLEADGKPHWAKEYRMTPQQFRELYPCWDKFVKIRADFDPERRFINANLERIFPD